MAAGSWLGLPELGISEMLGGNKTSLYNPRQISDAQRNPYSKGGSVGGVNVLGTKTVPTTYYGAPSPQRTAGVYTSNSGNSDISSLQSDKSAQESKLRSSIKERGSSYKSYLDNLAGYLPQYEAEDTNFINEGFQSSLDNLTQAKQAGLNKLGINRGKVDQYKANSIQDLQADLRNQMMATQMQLGAMGAGDSSASQVMAPYAFAKAGSQARSGILRDANSQYAGIDSQEQDLTLAYDTERSNIERDKIDALSNIKADYRNKFLQIQEAKNYANDRQRGALENLEMSLLDEVSGKLSQVQSFVLQRNAELEDWARTRFQNIGETSQKVSNPTDNTQRIGYDELPGLSTQTTTGVDYSYNPMALMRNKRQDLFA